VPASRLSTRVGARPDWIQVGRVAKAHGVQGEVRVEVYTDNPERFTLGSRVFACLLTGTGGPDSHSSRRELHVESVRGSDEAPIVAFREVRGRDDALRISGSPLEVPGEDLPETEGGTYYPFELEGLKVRSASGQLLGTVYFLLESAANEVLVVDLVDGGEALVPFTESAVPVVDVPGGYIEVREAFLARTLGEGEKGNSH